MSKKAKTKQAEEPKRIFKEEITIEVPKSQKEILEAQSKLQDLVMQRYKFEQQIEKAKLGINNLKNEIKEAEREANSDTKDQDIDAIVKVFPGRMEKEFWITVNGEEVLHKTEECRSWELQAEVDDLNYDPDKEDEDKDN